MKGREYYFIEKISCFLLFAFIVANFLPFNIRNIIIIILLIISIYYIFREKILLTVNSDACKLLKSYIYFFIIIFFFILYHNSSFRELDTYSRFILVIPLFYLFSQIKINHNHFFITIIITSIVIGVSSIYLYVSRDVGIDRISGFTDVSITFGNMCMTIFLLGLVSLIQNNTKLVKILLIISMILSLLAWSFSLSKGSLLGLTISLLYLIMTKKIITSKRNSIIILTFFILFVYMSPATKSINTFINDIKSSPENFSQIYKDNNVSFSTRERVFLLVNAKELIRDNYITGIGFDNFKKYIINKTESVNRIYGLGQHDHAHNDFIDIWVKAGVFCFLALIYFFFIHLKVLMRHSKKNDNFFPTIGIVLLLSQIGFMLTQSQLAHHQPTLFFLVLLIISISQTFLNKRN